MADENMGELPAADDTPRTLEQGWAKGYYITDTLPELESGAYRDVAREAVWTLSSARAGDDVDKLMSDDPDTFWQSDGAAPHTVTIQFYARHSVAEVCIHVNHVADESYCPERFLIKAGTTLQDLEDVRDVKLVEPSGWVRVPVGVKDSPGANRYLRTWVVQVCVLAMHQNGRDGHVRCIKLLAPAAGHGEDAGELVEAVAAHRAALRNAESLMDDGGGGRGSGGAPGGTWMPGSALTPFTTAEMQRFADVR